MSQETTTASGSDQERPAASGRPVVKIALVIVLAFFLTKPYWGKLSRREPPRQIFKVQGETMGTTWQATIID